MAEYAKKEILIRKFKEIARDFKKRGHLLEIAYAVGIEMLIDALEDESCGIFEEAKPVVHAHWENREFVNNSWIGIVCSNCEKHPLCDGFGKKIFSGYCPYCGAQMDEEASETKGE